MLRGQQQRLRPKPQDCRTFQGGWTDLPVELLERVLLSLPAKDCWNARQVTPRWTSLARNVASFEVSIPTQANKITSKLRILSKQGFSTSYPRVTLSLNVGRHLLPCECASVLAHAHGLGHEQLDVNLDINIRFDGSGNEPHHSTAVVAESLRLLKEGIRVRLNIQPNPRYMPSATSLHTLGPFLHSIMYYMESDQLVQATPSISVMTEFTPTQLAALSSARSMQALCISTEDLRGSGCHNIASMKCLTKLHLSVQSVYVDFQPLGHLSMLEDLALQCFGPVATCPEVLLGSKSTLQHVQLSSHAWETETYQALHSLSSCSLVVVRVQCLNTPSAQVMSNLSGPEIRLSLCDCTSMRPLAFRFLSTGMANIKELMLWQLNETKCEHLQSMPNLERLTIVRSADFSGITLKNQPGLTSLTLISCINIQASGLVRMVAAFPAMQHFALLSDPAMSFLPFDKLHARGKPSSLGLRQAISRLSECPKLQHIDLRGSFGISKSDIDALQAAFQSKQVMQKASPKVVVLWSTHGRRWPQSTVEVSSDLQIFPRVYMMQLANSDQSSGVRVVEPGLGPACHRGLVTVRSNCFLAAYISALYAIFMNR